MKKGIFAKAWEQAMERQKPYKEEKLKQIKLVQSEFKGEVNKRATGVLSGIGLYYLQRIKNFFKSFFKNKVNKK
ncbi:hypothetical protein HN784_00075 [bacterium]|jgi:hypothetical protein|nr:hypothetical protein [bacterium]MBT4251024.1 hypothetical protein [bacterium]MBT4597744.1 hypothetical protein [bacterium]MBT6753839.1 hypothetical protein [bacterium]MBT7037449.1 hypothetical protein [bacterium]